MSHTEMECLRRAHLDALAAQLRKARSDAEQANHTELLKVSFRQHHRLCWQPRNS